MNVAESKIRLAVEKYRSLQSTVALLKNIADSVNESDPSSLKAAFPALKGQIDTLSDQSAEYANLVLNLLRNNGEIST